MKAGNINEERFKKVYENVNNSLLKSGREKEDVTVIAVTKSFPAQAILSAVEYGITNIGESRVQEADNKVKQLKTSAKITTHLIGHLQSNKARKASSIFNIIHSVDSLKLAERISRISEEKHTKTRIFLQINIGNETRKHGISEESSIDTGLEINSLPGISLEGIMVIPPVSKKDKETRRYFQKTRDVQQSLKEQGGIKCTNLSMGMSSDFGIAIEEGATHLRIGTALFGHR